jgi:anti-anti-sigma factor
LARVRPELDHRRIITGTLTIDVWPEGETCLLRTAGELDMGSADALQKELYRALSAAAGPVILDLEELVFIDSAGLQCLLRATKLSRANGNRLRFLGARGEVARILTLTGVGRVLPHTTLPSALTGPSPSAMVSKR